MCYLAEDSFALHIRMIAAFVFVSPNRVIQLFDDLPQLIRNAFGQDADYILDYFEDNYIDRFCHNTPRREPLFPIKFGICLTVQTRNYLEPITPLKAGTEGSRLMWRHIIQHFESS